MTNETSGLTEIVERIFNNLQIAVNSVMLSNAVIEQRQDSLEKDLSELRADLADTKRLLSGAMSQNDVKRIEARIDNMTSQIDKIKLDLAAMTTKAEVEKEKTSRHDRNWGLFIGGVISVIIFIVTLVLTRVIGGGP